VKIDWRMTGTPWDCLNVRRPARPGIIGTCPNPGLPPGTLLRRLRFSPHQPPQTHSKRQPNRTPRRSRWWGCNPARTRMGTPMIPTRPRMGTPTIPTLLNRGCPDLCSHLGQRVGNGEPQGLHRRDGREGQLLRSAESNADQTRTPTGYCGSTCRLFATYISENLPAA
jgi:hypothetical protein